MALSCGWNGSAPLASWLDQNIRSYKDTLLNVDARMAYLKAAQNVTIYAQSDDSASPMR